MKYLLLITIFLFSGCSVNSVEVKKIFQTDDSTYIQHNYNDIVKLILEYKIKLDKRNPNNYNKNLSLYIINSIKSSEDSIIMYTKDKRILKNHIDYFNYTFSSNIDIDFRNDYLIIGLYKLFHDAFTMKESYKFSSYGYDLTKIQKLYKNLQILQWKIKHNKDSNGNYLFNTWQLNWQIKLLNQYNKSKNIEYEEIKNFNYIKNKTESIFDSSNNSFEKLLDKMIFHVENSIYLLDMTPESLTTEILKTAIFIL